MRYLSLLVLALCLPCRAAPPDIVLFLSDDHTFSDCGPYGAKEAGEGPLNPVVPAIANAVYDAIGVRIDETPITPEKILRALGKLPGRPATNRIGPDGLETAQPDPKPFIRKLQATSAGAAGDSDSD